MTSLPGDPAEKAEELREAFTGLNRKFEDEGAQRRAATIGLPYFDLRGFPIEQEALMLISEQQARELGAIPFDNEARRVKLGFVDLSDGVKQLITDLETQKYQVELYQVSAGALESALAQYHKILTSAREHEEALSVPAEAASLERLKSVPQTGERPMETTQLLGLIIGSAIVVSASDIHLEPEKETLKIRFRIDGVLQDVASLPVSYHHGLISRIKLLSKMKLNVTATPQDGRFSVRAVDRSIDLRVSVLPSAYGESVVIRLLGTQAISVDIEKLGLRDRDMELLKRELDKPNGMILTTGPTGSGKTTTLYAFLRYLNHGGVKIITLEDPVEYEIEGITQTPIDHSAGMDFATGLRSILRQDPDIVMVGEIRDLETG